MNSRPRENSDNQTAVSVPRDTYYDAVTQEYVNTTADKLKIWLDECQKDVLKDKCNAFTSTSNFIAVFGILLTLITTLSVTDFPNALWELAYIYVAIIIFFILVCIVCKYVSARRKKPMKLSECVLQKIKDSSIVTTGEDM